MSDSEGFRARAALSVVKRVLIVCGDGSGMKMNGSGEVGDIGSKSATSEPPVDRALSNYTAETGLDKFIWPRTRPERAMYSQHL